MIVLREYQKEIVDKGIITLNRHKIVYLSMEVRTGKTLTALSIARGYKSVLFVTKKRLFHLFKMIITYLIQTMT